MIERCWSGIFPHKKNCKTSDHKTEAGIRFVNKINSLHVIFHWNKLSHCIEMMGGHDLWNLRRTVNTHNLTDHLFTTLISTYFNSCNKPRIVPFFTLTILAAWLVSKTLYIIPCLCSHHQTQQQNIPIQRNCESTILLETYTHGVFRFRLMF